MSLREVSLALFRRLALLLAFAVAYFVLVCVMLALVVLSRSSLPETVLPGPAAVALNSLLMVFVALLVRTSYGLLAEACGEARNLLLLLGIYALPGAAPRKAVVAREKRAARKSAWARYIEVRTFARVVAVDDSGLTSVIGIECHYPGCHLVARHTCGYCGEAYCGKHVYLGNVFRLGSLYNHSYCCSLCQAKQDAILQRKKASAARRHLGQAVLGFALLAIWWLIILVFPASAGGEMPDEPARWLLALALFASAVIAFLGLMNWEWIRLFGAPVGEAAESTTGQNSARFVNTTSTYR